MAEKRLSPQEEEALVARVREMRSQQSLLLQKIQELEGEAAEHRLVLANLEKVEGERVCHRLVGGILVQTTAGAAKTQVEQNIRNIAQLVETLRGESEQLQKTMTEFMSEHNIRFVSQEEAAQMRAAQK